MMEGKVMSVEGVSRVDNVVPYVQQISTSSTYEAESIIEFEDTTTKVQGSESHQMRGVSNRQDAQFLDQPNYNLFQEDGEVDIVRLDAIANMVNSMLKTSYRRLDISVHEKTKKVMVKIIDTSSDELIREVPPEKALDILANMWELAGILLDTKG